MSYRSELAIQAAAQGDRAKVAPLDFFRARLTTRPDETAPQAVKAFLVATTPHGVLSESGYTLREIADARIEALRLGAILTVADIPAGQGPASLYVDEYGVVKYRAASGRSVVIPAGWDPTDADEWSALNAALDHLAATLPHVTLDEPAP